MEEKLINANVIIKQLKAYYEWVKENTMDCDYDLWYSDWFYCCIEKLEQYIIND